MRSMAVKEWGSCTLLHLISKPCEYRYSTMPSSLEHGLFSVVWRVEKFNALGLTVSFQEKLENERQDETKKDMEDEFWLAAIEGHSAFQPIRLWLDLSRSFSIINWLCSFYSIPSKNFPVLLGFFFFFSQFPYHFTIWNFIIFSVSRPTLRPDISSQWN